MPEAANTGEKPDHQDRTVVAIDWRGGFSVNALPVAEENLSSRSGRVLEEEEGKGRLSQG